MGKFLTPLDARFLDNGRDVMLLAPLSYQMDMGAIITAEIGFVTDLTSSPKIFWNVVPPMGLYQWGAVIHDWCYRHNGKVIVTVDLLRKQIVMNRRDCDRLLWEAAAAKGTPRATLQIIYDALRVGGQSAWDEDAKKLQNTIAERQVS